MEGLKNYQRILLRSLNEALAAVDKTGERYYEAEMHRLKGELLLARYNILHLF